MKLQDWLPIILMVGVFLVYLPFRRVFERLPDWLVYALCLAAGGLTVLTAILARATEYLAFVVAFFALAFVHLVHTRRQQRQAGSAS